MAFSITGQIKVATLKKRFLKEFGLTLRVYDGRSFADEGQTISQIRKKKGSGDLSVRKSMKVGTLEEKIESEFGIKVQIAGSDDSYLCKNELTLASANEKDQKRINKKDKKSKDVKSDSPITDKENENIVDQTSENTLTEDQIEEFKETEKEAEDSYDLRDLADEIVEAGDKEWAKKIYMKAESKAEGCNDFTNLAASIHENLGDKEWAKKLYMKAESQAGDSSDFRYLADSIHENLGDKEWAKKHYKKAEETAVGSFDLDCLAGCILENLGDKEWATKLYMKNENTVDKTSEVKGGKGDVKIIIQGRRITTFSFACLDDKYVEDIKKAIKFTDGLNEENLLHSILNSTIGEDFEDLKSEIDMDKIEKSCPTLYKLLNKLEHSNLPESDKIEEFITPYPEPILYIESGHLISITIDGETKVDEQPLGEFLNINESIVLDEIEDEEDLELENSVLVQKAKEFCNEQKETLGLDPDYATVYKCNNGMMLIEGALYQPELVKMQKNENQITISGEVRGYVNFYLNDKNFDLDKLTFIRNDNYSEWIASDIVGNYLFYDNKKIKEYDFDQHNIFQLCDYGGSGYESLKFYFEC